MDMNLLHSTLLASRMGKNMTAMVPILLHPTPSTLSMAVPPELSGAIPLIDKFQAEGFLRAMQKQIQSVGKRGFFFPLKDPRAPKCGRNSHLRI
ncbi:unnamed protein product [Camellia sinensis]